MAERRNNRNVNWICVFTFPLLLLFLAACQSSLIKPQNLEEILAADVPAAVLVVTEPVSQPSLLPTPTAIVKSTDTISTIQLSPTINSQQLEFDPTSTIEISTPSPVPYATFDPSLPNPATAIPQPVAPLEISNAATK